ncbi:flavin reductase family protein [Flavobacteriales bacterium]|nr:flavin reductase family protein [Flavobacteriales bacterium]MDC3394883.1 flavin reductase family protein [Flavobacteriales bacterium]
MYLNKDSIQQLEKVDRLNLINSITGISPANLIGTISKDSIENLAIFSSIVHIGSNPPLMGFILRPTKKIRRDTYENIIETNKFTINHINSDMVERSHYTSVKFDKNESEFQKCRLTAEYLNNFQAPYVKESYAKVGLELEDIQSIKSNGCRLIIGRVERLYVPDSAIYKNGNIQLDLSNSIGVGGLNTYYSLDKIAEYPYARVNNLFLKEA